VSLTAGRLGQPDQRKQSLKPWIGTQIVEGRFNSHPDEPQVTLLERLFERKQRFLLVT
jgi:hypothetical protein